MMLLSIDTFGLFEAPSFHSSTFSDVNLHADTLGTKVAPNTEPGCETGTFRGEPSGRSGQS
jgi:hypothetical protein